jgi:hypothetical protein
LTSVLRVETITWVSLATEAEGQMGGFAFSIPVVPGKEELDRRTLDEMLGARREEYEAALRQAGVTRQTIWHQETPNGTVAVIYVEGDDPQAGIAQFGSSDEPISAWFREQMKEVHGVDISQVELRATKVHDIQL